MESSNSTEEKSSESQSEPEEQEEKSFVANLYGFMKERNTPIERIPHLGFKQGRLQHVTANLKTVSLIFNQGSSV